MGLDIHGYSNIDIQKLPKNMIDKITQTTEKTYIVNDILKKGTQGAIALYVITNGIEDKFQNAINNNQSEFTVEATYNFNTLYDDSEFCKMIENEHFIQYNEKTLQTYWTSNTTYHAGAPSDYGTSGQFCMDINKIRKELNITNLPSLTAPCDAIYMPDQCNDRYNLLKQCWNKYYNIHGSNKECSKIDTELDNIIHKTFDNKENSTKYETFIHIDFDLAFDNFKIDYFLNVALCYWLGSKGGVVTYG